MDSLLLNLGSETETIRRCIICADSDTVVDNRYKKLLGLARGEFIAHLDGDDYWLPGKLQRQLNFLHQNPGCNAAYTNALVIDRKGRKLGIFNDVRTQLVDLGFLVRRGNFLHMSSTLPSPIRFQ